MTEKNLLQGLKKLFSMKNDTVDDAKRRFKRALICIPISIIPTLLFIFFKDIEGGTLFEKILFGISALCYPVSFVAMSSIIAPIKAGLIFVKWLFSNRLTGLFIVFYPILLILAPAGFCYILLSSFAAPIFITLYGVKKSKQHLDELEEKERILDRMACDRI